MVLEDELGSARRQILILNATNRPEPGTDLIPVVAHREAIRRKEQELTNEMTIQLSHGHVEITRRFKEAMESLNDEVHMLKTENETMAK